MSGHTNWNDLEHKNQQEICRTMAYGNWALDHGRPGNAPCMKPKGHDGPHDPDYDPDPGFEPEDLDQVVRDFINSHTLAMLFVPAESIGPYDAVRHEPEGCKHCEALAALDALQEEQRSQIADLLQMIIEVGRMKEEEIVKLRKQLEDKAPVDQMVLRTVQAQYEQELSRLRHDLRVMTERKDEFVEELRECNIALHDQQKHELGAKCGELQDKLTAVLAVIEQSPDVSPRDKIKVREAISEMERNHEA